MSKKNIANRTTLMGIIASSAITALSGCGTTPNVESRVSAAAPVNSYASQSQMAGNRLPGLDGNYIKASVEWGSSSGASLHLDLGNKESDGTDASLRGSYHFGNDSPFTLGQRMQLPGHDGKITVPFYDPEGSLKDNSLFSDYDSVPTFVKYGIPVAAVAGIVLASNSGSSSDSSSEENQENSTEEEKDSSPGTGEGSNGEGTGEGSNGEGTGGGNANGSGSGGGTI